MVTGASSGIGRAIALKFARQGADLIVHGRTESDQLKTAVAEFEECGSKVQSVFLDFSRAEPKHWIAMVDEAWSAHGPIHCWVNNAGGDVLTGDWKDKPIDQKLAYLWQTDVVSALMLSKRIGERMLDACSDPAYDYTNGAIVNIGWDQAWQGMAGDSGELFATTKGSIMSMTKSLAQSFAPHVRVNCVAPGWIKTKWGEQTSDYWNDRAIGESLMQRWGTPNDVANAVAFLCSDESSFINGHVLPVNGGFRFG